MFRSADDNYTLWSDRHSSYKLYDGLCYGDGTNASMPTLTRPPAEESDGDDADSEPPYSSGATRIRPPTFSGPARSRLMRFASLARWRGRAAP